MDEQLKKDIELKKIEIRRKLEMFKLESVDSGKNKGQTQDKLAGKPSSSKKLKMRRSTRKSQSPKRSRSRSPREAHSSRKRRSPLRSRSPRSRRSHRKPSRSPRKRHSRSKSRTPRRSRTPRKLSRRSRTPQKSRSPLRPRKSRTPTRKTMSRDSQSPPHYRGKKRSPLYKTARKSPSPRHSMFPWPKHQRTSTSPQSYAAVTPPPRTGKPILNRRYTSYFSKTQQDRLKPSAPVPPRMQSGKNERPPHDRNGNFADEPLTIISVLSILTALEDILGSLGPKVIDLMYKAKAMDKTQGNSSDQLLDNDDNCILFETIKEKLKGLVSANLVERNKESAVKKAIKNMATLVHQTNERQKACKDLETVGVKKKPFVRTESQQGASSRQEVNTRQVTPPPVVTNESMRQKTPDVSEKSMRQETPPWLTASKEERAVIRSKLSTALINQGRTDITDKQLEDYIEAYLIEAEKKKQSLESDKNTSTERQDMDEVMSTSSIDRIDVENKDELYDHITNRVDVVQVRSARPVASTNAPVNAQPQQSSSVRPVVFSLNRSAAPSLNRLPTPSSSIGPILAATDPQLTRHKTPSAQPSKVPKMCPPPRMEDVTLSDSDLRILMRKFDVLSNSEKQNYLSYMEKLKAADPERFKRLNDENVNSAQQPKTNIPSPIEESDKNVKPPPNDRSKTPTSIKANSNRIYSPGEHILSDQEGPTKAKNVFDDSDSDDSDDSAILASSIANSQQQIAQMKRDLNPVNAGSRIPVISSVQSLERMKPPRQLSNPTLPPTVHYQQQQHPFQLQPPFPSQPQHPFQPHQQQFAYPPQYQQHLGQHPPTAMSSIPGIANYYNEPLHPQYYHPRY